MDAKWTIPLARSFLTLFCIGFVKMQLFVIALYAFGALRGGEASVLVVVVLQAALAIAFAWYDFTMQAASNERSEPDVAGKGPRIGRYLAAALLSFTLLWSILLLAEGYSEIHFGESRMPGTTWTSVALLAALSLGAVASLYSAHKRVGGGRNRPPDD